MVIIMIVITAASGKLGTLVADQFAAKGMASTVRLAPRAPEKLDAYKAKDSRSSPLTIKTPPASGPRLKAPTRCC